MARSQRKSPDTRGPLQRSLDRIATDEAQSLIDVITPEQRAKGRYEAHGGRRYFKVSHLDRLHRNGKLTYDQLQAGKWYRDHFDLGRYDKPASPDYTRVRGQNVVQFDLPSSTQDARDRWRAARKAFDHRDVGFMDRLLLRDEWPRFGQHRSREAMLTTLRHNLDRLAAYLR